MRWKPVPGYEREYEVAEDGSVRSLPRQGTRGKLKEWKRVDPSGDYGQPHWAVSLHKAGKRKMWYVHRLVLMAFDRMPEDGEVGCHKDENAANNHISNLHWGSQSDNMREWSDARRAEVERLNKIKDGMGSDCPF